MEQVFNTIVSKLGDHIEKYGLKCLVLGISGGIDSTVVAAICAEVSKKKHIPFIGLSLPTDTNSPEETKIASLVGESFCTAFKTHYIDSGVNELINEITEDGEQISSIQQGNIKARIRMIYLMHEASKSGGLVIGTDNLTEHMLGFYTIFGDQGLFEPIIGLYKTEVYKLAEYIKDKVSKKSSGSYRARAIEASIALSPTDGNGISSDLEQIGASSYAAVDSILQGELSGIPESEVKAVKERLVKNEFKKHLPFCIERKELIK